MPDPFAALRLPTVLRYGLGRFVSVAAAQMVSLAVGWELYERTHSAWPLGLVGLFELIPVVLLALPAGQAADRWPRRGLAVFAHLLLAAGFGGLAWASGRAAPVGAFYALLLVVGCAQSLRTPALSGFIPQLVPAPLLRNANAWLSSSFELATIGGPALGGLLIAVLGRATPVYGLAAVLQVVFAGLLLTLPPAAPIRAGGRKARDLGAGVRFIFATQAFLAAITLDLFAVLFGGATALLPIFAKDLLHVGPSGLGALRAAPAVGACAMALLQTRLPPWKSAGRTLLVTVAGFGAATVGFGLSRSFWLSLFCLAVCGAFDNISVVIRVTLEQVLTPEALRGRVSAIHNIFIGFSNELGAFESGLTAALLGPVVSVVGGGLATLAVVGIVALVFPQLSRLGPLEELAPAEGSDDPELLAG